MRRVLIAAVALAVSGWGGAEDMPTLNWMEREKAVRADKNVVMKILRENKTLSYSVPAALTQRTQSPQSDAKSDNLLVQGDNLEALKALLPFYAGRVKCIYIDPPYNTGSAFEHYDDNLEHSQWLSMMYPRLKLLRDFLSEDGSIWISIDDDEQAYLKVICDEIFGRANFVATVVWQKKSSPQANAVWLSDSHDFVLVYARTKITWRPNLLARTEAADSRYFNRDNDPRGAWTSGDCSVSLTSGQRGAQYARTGVSPNLYEITTPSGRVVSPPSGNCWRFSKERFAELIADNRIWFGEKGDNVPRYKRFLSEVKDGVVAQTIWFRDDVGDNQEAKREVKFVNEQDLFATPKPERLIQRILTIATNPGDLVLDSFLGSGTTCAVAQKMGRRWIGIEMGEHAKTHCAVRLKKVLDGEQGGISKAVGWQGGGAFRFYELGEPILDENGAITESIPYETLAAHVWWRETGSGWTQGAKSTVLGVHKGVAYALLYNGILHDRSVAGGNVLTPKTLKVILADLGEAAHERLVVYGECTKIGAEKLKELRIEFRQTPYDIATGR